MLFGDSLGITEFVTEKGVRQESGDLRDDFGGWQ